MKFRQLVGFYRHTFDHLIGCKFLLEGGNYCIWMYLSFIQHKSREIVCILKVSIFGEDDIEIGFKDCELV